MSCDLDHHHPDYPLVSIPTPFVDSRGDLQVLLNRDIKSAVLITSIKGSLRANHYHKKDWHYCFVMSGSIKYYFRPTGSTDDPKYVLIEAGQMFFTPPMVDHAMVFPEDVVFIALSGSSREQDSYEDDLVRVELVTL